jgi:uncharacterized membrane protein
MAGGSGCQGSVVRALLSQPEIFWMAHYVHSREVIHFGSRKESALVATANLSDAPVSGVQRTVCEHAAKEHSVVAIYDTHTGAEAAIRALQLSGVDMKQLSIVGKDFQTEEHALGFYTSGDRMKFWGGRGAFWGSLWGMLFGGAFFLIPAVGPLVVMGPLVGWLIGALEGAAVGGAAGVLAAALTSVGIPKDSVVKYELAVKAGKFLVLARGSSEFVARARESLRGTSPAELSAHSC